MMRLTGGMITVVCIVVVWVCAARGGGRLAGWLGGRVGVGVNSWRGLVENSGGCQERWRWRRGVEKRDLLGSVGNG
ncbi:hypothetical protein F4804DRAFT_303451 [Jackrogersella minutella]|nr:hypothetical protein F4804DRAFT_303451 [Jackrogersella minutella]